MTKRLWLMFGNWQKAFVLGRTLSYKFVYIGVELDRSKTVFAILAMPEKCEAGHQCKRKISTLCKGRKGMRHPNSFRRSTSRPPASSDHRRASPWRSLRGV
jgi:hypothetical protein